MKSDFAQGRSSASVSVDLRPVAWCSDEGRCVRPCLSGLPGLPGQAGLSDGSGLLSQLGGGAVCDADGGSDSFARHHRQW